MLGGGDQTLDWAGVPSWPEGWRLARGHPSPGARSEPEGARADPPRSPGRPGAGATAPPPSLSGRSGAPGPSLGITPKIKRVRSLLRCTGGGRSSEETAFGGPPGGSCTPNASEESPRPTRRRSETGKRVGEEWNRTPSRGCQFWKPETGSHPSEPRPHPRPDPHSRLPPPKGKVRHACEGNHGPLGEEAGCWPRPVWAIPGGAGSAEPLPWPALGSSKDRNGCWGRSCPVTRGPSKVARMRAPPGFPGRGLCPRPACD